MSGDKCILGCQLPVGLPSIISTDVYNVYYVAIIDTRQKQLLKFVYFILLFIVEHFHFLNHNK